MNIKMNSTNNLIEFFKAHNIDILELKNNKDKEINLVIQILFLYFNIGAWYKTCKIKYFTLYNDLLNYDFKDILDTNKNYNLNNIPFNLRGTYITYIFEMLSKENASKDDCIKSIQYLNTMREIDNSKYYYNSIYITNNEHIFIVFIYEDILIINVKTLDIYKEKDIIKSIIKISKELNNKEFFYQFIHICPNNSYRIHR